MEKFFFYVFLEIDVIIFTLYNYSKISHTCWGHNFIINKKYVLSNSESAQCNFFIFDHVTFIQFKLLCTTFDQNRTNFYWDMAIYRFSKWRPSAILKLFYHHTRPPTKSLLLAAAACQNSCQSDTQIWRAIWIFRIFGLKCLFRPPKWGFWGTLDP